MSEKDFIDFLSSFHPETLVRGIEDRRVVTPLIGELLDKAPKEPGDFVFLDSFESLEFSEQVQGYKSSYFCVHLNFYGTRWAVLSHLAGE